MRVLNRSKQYSIYAWTVLIALLLTGFIQTVLSHNALTFTDASVIRTGAMVCGKSALYTLFTSLFVHFSWTHLIANAILFWVTIQGCAQMEMPYRINPLWFLFGAVVQNVVEYFLYPTGYLSAGLSGMVFMLVAYLLCYKVTHSFDFLGYILAFLVITTVVILPSKEHVDYFAHLFGIIEGLLTYFVVVENKKRKDERDVPFV